MRARHQARVLRTIREIRALQESAAQLAASQSARRLHEEREREAQTADQLRVDQEAWARCMAAPGGLTIAGAWAQEVNRTEAALRRDQNAVRLAGEERSLRNDAWRRALVRAEAAEALSETAAQRLRRRAEEARLAELADGVSRRGGVA